MGIVALERCLKPVEKTAANAVGAEGTAFPASCEKMEAPA